MLLIEVGCVCLWDAFYDGFTLRHFTVLTKHALFNVYFIW